MAKNQIKPLIEQIHTSTNNLRKDIDHNDPREKTEEDLRQLSLSFQDLKELFSGLNNEDTENLNREFRELLSGKDNLQTYVQDVKKILIDVQERIKTDKKVEEKIYNSLPEDKQNETPNTLVQGFKTLIEKITHLNEKTGGRR
jgi:hypothetical protein